MTTKAWHVTLIYTITYSDGSFFFYWHLFLLTSLQSSEIHNIHIYMYFLWQLTLLTVNTWKMTFSKYVEFLYSLWNKFHSIKFCPNVVLALLLCLCLFLWERDLWWHLFQNVVELASNHVHILIYGTLVCLIYLG